MATRTVTFTFNNIDGTPKAGAVLVFKLRDWGTATDAPIYLREGKRAVTGTDGTGSIDLWVNEESEKDAVYQVSFEDSRESARFILPEGETDIDLSDLVINHAPASPSPQVPSGSTVKADKDADNISESDATAWRTVLNVEDGADVTPHIASQVEAEGGTDNTVLMTPLRSKQLIVEEQIYINVKDHGVTGDGTTDDRAAIQSVIDSAPETAVIFFPETATGYKIVGGLTLSKSVTLLGRRGDDNGTTGTILNFTITDSETPAITFSSDSLMPDPLANRSVFPDIEAQIDPLPDDSYRYWNDATLSANAGASSTKMIYLNGLTIKGDAYPNDGIWGAGNCDGVFLRGAHNFKIENCNITRFRGCGLVLSHCYYGFVDSCYFGRNGVGISGYAANVTHVINTRFMYNLVGAIQMAVFFGYGFEANGHYGWLGRAISFQVDFFGTFFEAQNFGTEIDGGADIRCRSEERCRLGMFGVYCSGLRNKTHTVYGGFDEVNIINIDYVGDASGDGYKRFKFEGNAFPAYFNGSANNFTSSNMETDVRITGSTFLQTNETVAIDSSGILEIDDTFIRVSAESAQNLHTFQSNKIVGRMIVLSHTDSNVTITETGNLRLDKGSTLLPQAGDMTVWIYDVSDALYHLVSTTASRLLSATATLDFGSISAGHQAELTVTVTGAQVGDAVYLAPPSAIESKLLWGGYVSAANTVTIRLMNVDGNSIDPASATWGVIVTPIS